MSEPSWFNKIIVRVNAKHLVLAALILMGLSTIYLCSPSILRLISPPEDVKFSFSSTKSSVFRPEGFSFNVTLLNKGPVDKMILIEAYPQDVSMVSRDVYLRAGEEKTEVLRFDTRTLGQQSFSMAISWVGPFDVNRVAIGQEDSSFTVLGADYIVEATKSILNIATRDTFSFRVTNKGNVGADLLDVRVVNKGVLSLASQEMISIPALGQGQSTVVDFTFSVPASAKEGELLVGVKLDAKYGDFKESTVQQIPLILQTSPTVRDIENANYTMNVLYGLVGTAIALAVAMGFKKR